MRVVGANNGPGDGFTDRDAGCACGGAILMVRKFASRTRNKVSPRNAGIFVVFIMFLMYSEHVTGGCL